MRISLAVTANGSDPAAELRRLSALRQTLPARLAAVAAAAGQREVLNAARSIRGSLSMSNNKKGRRLEATPIVRRGSGRAEAEIQATPRGPWHLANYGAEGPYQIRPMKGPGGRTRKTRSAAKAAPAAKGKKAKKGRQPAVRTPQGVFAFVTHPGASGSHAWDRGMEAAEPRIDQAVQEAFEDAVLESVGL